MSYLVFARKYRPENFLEVQGQKHVTQTLKNAIKKDRVGHAYLFAGPRGVGKTSIARIFAKALNCLKAKNFEPCGKCENCKAIKAGTHVAVREIDGASNNSVDNVRELVDSFRIMPPSDVNYKIYIIDEVHMLSNQAFNALLKSLEEPPEKTVFILATTEIHKIIPTVISRCQRFDFRAMSQEKLLDGIKKIVKEEKIKIDVEVLRMIARLADGSMRDAQSLLERVVSFSESNITIEDASEALGAVDRVFLEKLITAIINKNSEEVFLLVDELNNSGFDSSAFLKEFVSYWQELLRASFGGVNSLTNLGISETVAKKQVELASTIAKKDLEELVRIAREGADSAIRSNYPYLSFEALAVRMANRVPVKDIEDIISGLRKFSKSIKSEASNSSSSQLVNSVQTVKKKVLEPETKKQIEQNLEVESEKVVTLAIPKVNSPKAKPLKIEEFKLEEPRATSKFISKETIPNEALISEESVERELTKNLNLVPKDTFLRTLRDAGIARILLEHLRLSELEFKEEVLILKANNFSYSYFSKQENIAVLVKEIKKAYSVKLEITLKLLEKKTLQNCDEIDPKNADYGVYSQQIKDLIEIFPNSIVERRKI